MLAWATFLFFFFRIGYSTTAIASHSIRLEPVEACVFAYQPQYASSSSKVDITSCLGWRQMSCSLCGGAYEPIVISPMTGNMIQISADSVSFYIKNQPSMLQGQVEVKEKTRVVSANTAYIYRDDKSNKVTTIELLDFVQYKEPNRFMLAKKVRLDPRDQSGYIEQALYRFDYPRKAAILPAWGTAARITRFPNKDLRLEKASYSYCMPRDPFWQLEADEIILEEKKERGLAKNARLKVAHIPLLYTPYFYFPLSKARKSGFLMPVVGRSNVGGVDLTIPYYWNMAPNYDSTLFLHPYSKRGVLLGDEFRYLTINSVGIIHAAWIPSDQAFKNFLFDNKLKIMPASFSTNRWSLAIQDSSQLMTRLHLGLNFKQVSDPYFLQDFSNNWAIMTERQLRQETDLTYTLDHWVFRGMLERYQTLNPINETPVLAIYQRLPQLMALGSYDELPLNGTLTLLGQLDHFYLPATERVTPRGWRYYLDPLISLPQKKPWGFLTPNLEWLTHQYTLQVPLQEQELTISSAIPRYSLEGGLLLERFVNLGEKQYTQTLEPRFFYLYVPYRDQTQIPVFDSAYMIFSYEQLFRSNRFSGFDRIGDANQLTYAVQTRWLNAITGSEQATFAIGQIYYFSPRKVLLCHSLSGDCIDDPLTLGYLSPLTSTSPIASQFTLRFNPQYLLTGDYIWWLPSWQTNNAHLNIHYQPDHNQILRLGYAFLANGDNTRVAYVGNVDNSPLHQINLGFAWPLNRKWSTLGAFNYNISKRYEMLSFFGVQYDSCCWAMRLMGGRSFQSLDAANTPQYNKNIYFQILLKGLGAVGTDPSNVFHTFLPGYIDTFHN